MGRTIIAEEDVHTYVDSITTQRDWTIGVIIGQLTNQKDYVVHMARTPEEEEGEHDDAAPQTQSLLDVDENWVASHAKQVENMLPGGLSVIGIFAIAQPNVLKNVQHKLRQIVFATHKMLNKGTVWLGDNETTISDRILLQICAVTRKLTCRTFDVTDNNSSSRPAEWKYQSFVERWLSLSCGMSVDTQIPVTIAMGSKSLKKQIQVGLHETCENIRNSLALLNNQLYADDDQLDTSQSSKKKRHGGVDQAVRHYDVSLFTQMTKEEAQDPVCDECCAQMLIRGTVECKAYVNNKSTAKQALTALKNDLIRTLIHRCDLLCEDLLAAEEDQDPTIVYETPRRVFTTLPCGSIQACDYVFVDETCAESRDRFSEVLDVDASDGDIDMECERLPSVEELVKPSFEYEEDDVTPVDSASSASIINQRSHIPVTGILTAGVAILAIVMSYMYWMASIP